VFFDPLYFVVLMPAMLVSAWAAWATRSRFQRYAQIPNARRIRGAEVARLILDRNGLSRVRIEATDGTLSDHYDPSQGVVRLSEDVYYGGSVAALAIAAHETGHAIQHSQRYAPLALRNLAVPVARLGSNFAWFLIAIGFMLSAATMVWAGVVLFSGTVAFQLATLPVELDASRRAKEQLERLSLVLPSERVGVRSVLSAAAMTYVGAALTGISTLLYFLIRLGVFSPRER
jgi:uncharacterized protein